jgi:hypothetical protein
MCGESVNTINTSIHDKNRPNLRIHLDLYNYQTDKKHVVSILNEHFILNNEI